MRCISIALTLVLGSVAVAQPSKATPGNRLAYLDELDPYYPHAKFPKLITPQWVGEDGVEAVVILAIDDMRDPAKYEAYLRPILRRLQKIDGRAPVSIMTCSVKPDDPQLQTWLKEGLSIECHTVDHPCPFFKIGFEKAKSTYDRCVDLMNDIPGNKPVAFRMPCCDSMNTPSPRHYAEIFNKTTAKGNFLSIDSSVFVYYTSDDPELPKSLTLDAEGKERFKRYLPMDRSFVNTIENYPYPCVIGNLCWQFPCMTPSDWQAQHLQKPNNPKTIEDWKAALDCTVIKQGVFNMVFHPHGWIRNDQVVEFIDHAVAKHGKKVKFLTFKEALERLNKNLLGEPIRDAKKRGELKGVRLLDVNNDGYADVVNGTETRIWFPKTKSLIATNSLNGFWSTHPFGRLGVLRADGKVSYFFGLNRYCEFYQFKGDEWGTDPDMMDDLLRVVKGEVLSGLSLLRDLDGDGRCEVIHHVGTDLLTWTSKAWKKLPYTIPAIPSYPGMPDTGFRFRDLNADGKLDIIVSNEKEYGIYLFTDMEKGWSKKVLAGKRGERPASATGVGAPGALVTQGPADELPMISRHGTNNGFWVHSGYLWWSNEDTAFLKDHVDRRKIADLLRAAK